MKPVTQIARRTVLRSESECAQRTLNSHAATMTATCSSPPKRRQLDPFHAASGSADRAVAASVAAIETRNPRESHRPYREPEKSRKAEGVQAPVTSRSATP